MLTNDDVTTIQLAVEKGDLGDLIDEVTAEELTELQLFAHHTLLMYALEKGDPKMVESLVAKGVKSHELEWSDNNELKSALNNEKHRNEMLPLALDIIPADVKEAMITSDWDPEEPPSGTCKSPLEMASELEDKTCLELLKAQL